MSNPGMADVADSGVAAEELKQFISRLEHIQDRIDDLNGDKKEVYAELKGRGFNPKIVKQIMALRRKDAAEVQEDEALLELYKQALGMA